MKKPLGRDCASRTFIFIDPLGPYRPTGSIRPARCATQLTHPSRGREHDGIYPAHGRRRLGEVQCRQNPSCVHRCMTRAISSAISSIVKSAVLRATLSANDGLSAITCALVKLCQIGSTPCSPDMLIVVMPSSSYWGRPFHRTRQSGPTTLVHERAGERSRLCPRLRGK